MTTPELGALRALAGGISESEMLCVVIRLRVVRKFSSITKDSEITKFQFPDFVLFATFVVNGIV